MRGRARFAGTIVLLTSFALAECPAITGSAAHEWLGLGVTLALLIHVAVRAERFAGFKRGCGVRSNATPARLVLDVMLFITLGVCCVSGAMVSGEVLPAFGAYATGYYFWSPLHSAAAKLLAALLLVHLAASWRPLLAGTKRKATKDDDRKTR